MSGTQVISMFLSWIRRWLTGPNQSIFGMVKTVELAHRPKRRVTIPRINKDRMCQFMSFAITRSFKWSAADQTIFPTGGLAVLRSQMLLQTSMCLKRLCARWAAFCPRGSFNPSYQSQISNMANHERAACRFTYGCSTFSAPAVFGIIARNSRAFEFSWTLEKKLGASQQFSWVALWLSISHDSRWFTMFARQALQNRFRFVQNISYLHCSGFIVTSNNEALAASKFVHFHSFRPSHSMYRSNHSLGDEAGYVGFYLRPALNSIRTLRTDDLERVFHRSCAQWLGSLSHEWMMRPMQVRDFQSRGARRWAVSGLP